MTKYIDLSSVVDVEPEVCEVLPLIEDDDLQYEFWQRLDEGFFKDFLCNHCNENDLSTMKEILDEIIEDSIVPISMRIRKYFVPFYRNNLYTFPFSNINLRWK